MRQQLSCKLGEAVRCQLEISPIVPWTQRVWKPLPTGSPCSLRQLFFLSGRCDRAEAAAVLESLPVLPSRRTLDAAVPALGLECCRRPFAPTTPARLL